MFVKGCAQADVQYCTKAWCRMRYLKCFHDTIREYVHCRHEPQRRAGL